MVVADDAAHEAGDDRSLTAQRRRAGSEVGGATFGNRVPLALPGLPKLLFRLDADGGGVPHLQLPCPALSH